MASGSGITTSSARITNILLPTARKASLGPTPVPPMSASSSSSPSQSGRASRVENDQNICAICADVFLWRERSTTLSCGHIFHPSLVEDLAQHLRRRLFGGVIAINCPLCPRPILMSSISSFEHIPLVPEPCRSFAEFARRYLTQHR